MGGEPRALGIGSEWEGFGKCRYLGGGRSSGASAFQEKCEYKATTASTSKYIAGYRWIFSNISRVYLASVSRE